ncbi:MAG: hypothetical protein JWQ79_3714 [Mucilaginibacter sp.]|jgi:hypothetical protein|nr:hypothetical protein [Mucilaginibacter sp.]
MPFEIFAIPVLICLIIGVINGIKRMDKEEVE